MEDIVVIGSQGRGGVIDNPDSGSGNNKWGSAAAVRVLEDATWMRVHGKR